MQATICAMLREKTLRIKNNSSDGDFMMQKQKLWGRLASVTLLGSLVACTGAVKDERDPLENWNRGVQSFNDHADEYVFRPLATGYRWITPYFVNEGVSNLFSNINDIGVTVNDLLQFKLTQTGLDGSRFLINSVAGVGGLVDVAEMLDLPKHKEDFDQTLGVWGVPMGPYVVLPFLGSSSPRAITGRLGDAAMNPVNYVGMGVLGLNSGTTASAISSGSFALKTLDARADHLGAEKVLNEDTDDRYEFLKNAYFQQRDYLVNDGKGADHVMDIE